VASQVIQLPPQASIPRRHGHGGADANAIQPVIQITYSERGGASKVLKLSMAEGHANAWLHGMQSLVKMVPPCVMPAHVRWTQSCMAATSERGATGVLRRSEVRSMMRCTNSSDDTTEEALKSALQLVENSDKGLKVPGWLNAVHHREGHGRHEVLSLRQVTGLLLMLGTSSPQITELFNKYSGGGQMEFADWLKFIRAEQLPIREITANAAEQSSKEDTQSELAVARERFAYAIGADIQSDTSFSRRAFTTSEADGKVNTPEPNSGLTDPGRPTDATERRSQDPKMSLDRSFQFDLRRTSDLTDESLTAALDGELSTLQFGLLLLSPKNMASAPLNKKFNELTSPFAHYWTATSHNSYCVGDQLTGRSTADAYRRQLLQGCRQLEIDCWDGPRQDPNPKVTHGHTFCTIEKFDAVARAIGECAFITAELPVVLSLEMHCSPEQQNRLTKMMIKHIGDYLLPYEEFLATGRAAEMSVFELRRRVLVKGKVKAKLERSDSKSSKLRSTKRSCYSLRASSSVISQSSRRSSMPPEEAGSEDYVVHEAAADARGQLEQQRRKSAKNKTDPLYAANICLRGHPVAAYRKGKRSCPLPITSISEEMLLVDLGVKPSERRHIEGVPLKRVDLSVGVNDEGQSLATEDQIALRAIVRLAASPPAEVGVMQNRTATWLLRPFPSGARFSGKNMSPLPCWLGGAQSIALNMSPINGRMDMAVQLHFALFNSTAGYVLKPPEMLSVRSPSESAKADEKREAGRPEGASEVAPKVSAWKAAKMAACKVANPASTVVTPSSVENMLSCLASAVKKQPAGGEASAITADDKPDAYWPPPREQLHVTTLKIISLHNLPKRGERRPQLDGHACHKYHPELSGTPSPPTKVVPSSPSITLSLNPIGGFVAFSKTLPLPQNVEPEISTAVVKGNGMNAPFGDTIHCAASEPHSTFLRIAVMDRQQEVAYESAVLGRLKRGYRVLQLRELLGTPIELCFLFVHISFASYPHLWLSPRQVQLQALMTQEKHKSQIEQHRDETRKLKDEVSRLWNELTSSQQDGASPRKNYSPHMHMQQHREETRKLQDEISRLQGELSAAKQQRAQTSIEATTTPSFVDASEDLDARDDHLLRL